MALGNQNRKVISNQEALVKGVLWGGVRDNIKIHTML